MRLRLLAVAVTGLSAALPWLPAQVLAAGQPVAVSLGVMWGASGNLGAWTPYVVAVKNQSGGDFNGDLFLVPNNTGAAAGGSYPVYRTQVSLGKGSERQYEIYVIDTQGGYSAQVRDSSGRTVASADPTVRSQPGSVFAVLSDVGQASQTINVLLANYTNADTGLAQFTSPQAFPTSAAALTGLTGIVMDQFDSSTLSQAQVQALQDFVGLGGVLIEAGGGSWRHTLVPLPPDLVPLQPLSTASTSLAALADLAGRAETAAASTAVGTLKLGRVALAAADGTPLVAEAAYGAGRIVELAFDPLAEPFTTNPQLGALAWSQAITRGSSGVLGATQSLYGGYSGRSNFGRSGGGGGGVAGPGQWSPGYGQGPNTQLYNLLSNSPAAASPPVGLMGGLLIGYVLLVGLLNYLFAHALGRRALMWVSVPAIAVGFTLGAYLVGSVFRGADFYLTQAEVQRLAPNGAVETYTFAAVYSPHRGDFSLSLPPGTLVSTSVAQGSIGSQNAVAVISPGSRPGVLFQGVPVWDARTIQSLSVSHPSSYEPRQAMALDAKLQDRSGHIAGTITNHTQHAVRQLELVTGSGGAAALNDNLAPGQTIQVDVQLGSSSTAAAPTSPIGVRAPGGGLGGASSAADSMLSLAWSQVADPRPGHYALIGLTDPAQSMSVDGGHPRRSALAAIAEPVDVPPSTFAAGPSPERLVSSVYGDGGNSSMVDVYELEVPAGYTGPLTLSYSLLGRIQPSGGATSVEVYDWDAHTWRALEPRPGVGQGGGQAVSQASLAAGETSAGAVRVRVHETDANSAGLGLAAS